MADPPHRVQLSRTKGWRMPPNTVKVDRSTRWGNPWAAGRTAHDGRQPIDNAGAVWMFIDMLADQERRAEAGYPSDAEIRAALRGKNLACWCGAGQPCHAYILLGIANARTCPKCHTPLRPGIAMGQTLTGGALDFASDPGPVTLSAGGPGRLIEVMKCPKCGHSETGGSDG